MNFYNKKLFKLDHSGNSLAIYPKKILIDTNTKLINGLKKLSKDNNNCNLRTVDRMSNPFRYVLKNDFRIP